MPTKRETYYDILTEAINDMADHGFDSAERVEYWQERLKQAADAMLMSNAEMEMALRAALENVYRRLVDRGVIVKFHKGISRFKLEQIRPHLRAELDRRIMASAQLIRLNRAAAIDQTLRRFAGWSTSIPKGGTAEPKKREEKAHIRKSLKSLPFETRRVLIDQGHKLTSSINDITARDGGALAGIWHSHWRQAGYAYRPDHKERDLRVYAIRGSWAMKQGLMTKGSNGYTDEITAPAEEPFCRCYYEHLYSLRQLPAEMITKKGAEHMVAARQAMKELA